MPFKDPEKAREYNRRYQREYSKAHKRKRDWSKVKRTREERSKLRDPCVFLDNWPYCHWRALTSTPCRKKPRWIYISTPVCDEHAKEFPHVDRLPE